jgi:hypothetical protein
MCFQLRAPVQFTSQSAAEVIVIDYFLLHKDFSENIMDYGLDWSQYYRKQKQRSPVIPLKSGQDRVRRQDVVVNSIGMKLIYIPPGDFMMGYPIVGG